MTTVSQAEKWQEYHERRNKWVAYNFPDTDGADPDMPCLETCEGVIEELGELAHCHLKNKQSIRGSRAEHEAGMKDAIGDATVYLWGITSRQHPSFTGENFWRKVDQRAASPARIYRAPILSMAKHLGDIAETIAYDLTLSPVFQRQVADFVGSMVAFCKSQGWDYHQIVDETWAGVEKRDWQRYPKDGLTK